jgi:hypothetical protein
LQESEGVPLEIIVVDNSSSDGSAAMVANEFPEVKLLAQSSNLGYAEANNIGMAASTGDTLLLLNPDVRVNRNTLVEASECLYSSTFRGAVGAKQIGPDGKVQRSLRSFPDPESLAWELLGLSKIFPMSRRFGRYRLTWFDYSVNLDVDQPMATFLMVKRRVYDKIGGMDTQFPIFFNDVDWCKRIKDAGFTITFCPDAALAHYGGCATSRASRPAMVRESHRSLALYFQKHYSSQLSPSALCMIQALAVASGELRARIGLR